MVWTDHLNETWTNSETLTATLDTTEYDIKQQDTELISFMTVSGKAELSTYDLSGEWLAVNCNI